MQAVTPHVPSERPGERDAGLAIDARNLSKSYAGQDAVVDLDLQVPRGTIFGFIGPSGSGKTTTIRMLTGIHTPDSGEVTVLGRPPSELNARERARIGYLPQLSVLFPSLTLIGNLNFVASIYGMPLRRKRMLRTALEFVELWEHRNKRLREVSGGMQRRLALAATLVHEPELLFLDEPTAGIDPILRRKLWDRFERLRADGATLFVTTQYVGEAPYCDLVAVLNQGRLVAVDTPDGLRLRAFGGEVVHLVATDPLSSRTLRALGDLPLVRSCERAGGDDRTARLVVVDRADEAIPRIMDWFEETGANVESVSQEQPPFDDVFVALIEGSSR